jgi:spore germination protein YaaH
MLKFRLRWSREEEISLQTEFRLERFRQTSGFYWFMLFFLSMMIAVVVSFVIYYFVNKPNEDMAAPYEGIEHPTWVNGELWNGNPIKMWNGQIHLPFTLMKSHIDERIFWDPSIESVIITTEDKVIRLPNQQLTAFVNEKPFQLSFPVQKEGEEIYIPLDPLKEIYSYHFTYLQETGVLLIDPFSKPIQMGEVVSEEEESETKAIRADTSIKEPIFQKLRIGERVRILGEKNGWYWVLSMSGIAGYMEKKDLRLGGIEVREEPRVEKPYVPWNPLGGRINLTWEQVVKRNPDVSTIPEMPGLNVVSPTWFEIIDQEGNIQCKADIQYVKWAHDRGYQVWGLVSNGFNPDRTSAFLNNYETRKKIIRQLIEYAHLYDLDGINLDFENVYLKDKEQLVQFVRELTPYLHEQNLVVSMDVTVKSSSENWSMFYDRKELGEVIDYMIVMTYDEHWATSPNAGSVASLPWVEKGLQGILEEVPAEKVILGVPFYTRLWTETSDEKGNIKVTQKAYSMDSAKKWLEENGVKPVYDEKTGQYYAEYVDVSQSVTYKIWLEEATSMQKRAELVKKYNLAGIASWRRGFESQDIWNVIAKTLSNRP